MRYDNGTLRNASARKGTQLIALIEDNRDDIAALCRQYGVRRLAVFGSAATGAFDPGTSDLDFVVDLGRYERGVARRYLGLIVALEQLFGRLVDVVTIHPGATDSFRKELERTAVTIYESGRTAAVA
jgi:predicted nucleotidyltransferase